MGNIPFLSNFQNGSQLVIGKIHLYIPLMLWILFIKSNSCYVSVFINFDK